MKTTGKKDVYKIVNDAIIDKLKAGTLPWKRTWNHFGPARNYVSNKPYRGINALLLNFTSSEYPLFLTFKQAKELGGHITKGAKGNLVVFWKRLHYHEKNIVNPAKLGTYSPDEVKTVPLLRYYYLFNIDCVEGVEFRLPERNTSLRPIVECEKIVAGMPLPPKIEHIGDQPSYNRLLDRVKIPRLQHFHSGEEYYSALFHELAHATGHPTRLNREKGGGYGSKEYSFEELIAEMTACFLSGEAGIVNAVIDNSAAYVQGWLEILTSILQDDDRFLVKASTQAQRAADYILKRMEHEAPVEEDKAELELEEKGV